MNNSLRLLTALLCGAWLAQSVGAGRPLPELLGDPAQWRQLDWAQAASSTVWQDHGWLSYLGKQSGNLSHDRIQAFRLDGIDWQATLDTHTDNGAPVAQLTVYSPGEDGQLDHCSNLYDWAQHHFGPPAAAVDGSYHIAGNDGTPVHGFIDRHYQWDVGTTRIIEDCQGQSTGSDNIVYAASSLRFMPLAAGNAVHPLISAKCSRSLRLTDSGDIPLKMSDIVFVIDENNGSIRRPDLVPIRVHNVQVGPQQIGFSLTLDQSTNDYHIDLPSGQLSANMSISGIRAGQVSGQCRLTPLSAVK
ncbi:MAG: hypothetical protein JO171_07330 [Paludibacterium sp.]|uniref:hypothetical protein n=1 Tax=Paludibacterium sp. TaxID=1917523 RepID=UPI0025E50AC0|nr:hypothetical protein [Paludibacterium sp.]MBV8046946.1 hypothetical protein [Paludibacterium sp.]MBV8646539.1 hypothetical protein [Paludibacterium sp.]